LVRNALSLPAKSAAGCRAAAGHIIDWTMSPVAVATETAKRDLTFSSAGSQPIGTKDERQGEKPSKKINLYHPEKRDII
jgi:hypothetical protein